MIQWILTSFILSQAIMALDATRHDLPLAFSNVLTSSVSGRCSYVDSLFSMAAYSEPVKTPASDIPYNFGPASLYDTVLFTAERPGNRCIEDATVSSSTVNEWIAFMKNQGIGHVLVLLDDNEFSIYQDPGLLGLYQAGGLSYCQATMGDVESYDRVIAYLQNVEKRGETAVTHCTGGIGRAGRVAAAWLVHRYNLDVEAATKDVIHAAIESKICRLGHAKELSKWIGNI
jgi:protein-tyrosine phosphatase